MLHCWSDVEGLLDSRVHAWGWGRYPPHLHEAVLKAQDTLVTNAPIVAQRMALAALRAGPDWVRSKVPLPGQATKAPDRYHEA